MENYEEKEVSEQGCCGSKSERSLGQGLKQERCGQILKIDFRVRANRCLKFVGGRQIKI